MSYYLFLDDERMPIHVTWIDIPRRVPWTIARNYDQFVACIQQHGLPVFISFDHDLGHEHYPKKVQTGTEVIEYDTFIEKTGYHCAQWLVTYCLDNKTKLPNFTVHSQNIVGRQNINMLLANFVNFQNTHE